MARRALTTRLGLAALLAVLASSGPSIVPAAELAGTSGPIAWRLADLLLGPTSIGGKEHAAYSFTLVLRTTDARPLRLVRYEAQMSYAGLTDESELGQSGVWSLAPAAEVRFALQSLVQCGEGHEACRLPVGPTWRVVLHGADDESRPLRQVLTFTLPPVPGQSSPPPTSVRRVSAPVPALPPGASPIQLRANLVFVDAVVNGVPVTFLLDTGAQLTMLSPATAARVGLVVRADTPRMPIVGLGAASVPLVIEGVLGGNFMALFRVTLDRRARELRLEPSDERQDGRR